MISKIFFERGLLLCATVALVISGCKGASPPTSPSITPPANVQIFSVTPATVSTGAKDVQIKITGDGFVQVSSVDLGGGLQILSREIPNPQLILLIVNVGKAADPGPRKVTVSTAGATAVLDKAFKVIKNELPVVRFTFSPQSGSIHSVYQFDASATSDNRQVVRFHWEFGDGEAANGVKVKHQFANAGKYVVRLTVTDNQEGASSAEKEVKVVDNLLPTASFTVSPQTGFPSTVFLFDGSSSTDPEGDLKSYQWDFGDGTTKGVVVRHQFSKAGSFRVVLTVKDSANAESVAEKRIDVEKEPSFDRDRAIREINDVVVEFLVLYGRFEELSAEQIVIGFSNSSACRGRDREIAIIRDHQAVVREQNVDVFGPADVTSVNEQKGRALLRARFYGTNNDGTTFDGVNTHDFSMIFENDGWKICNFSLL